MPSEYWYGNGNIDRFFYGVFEGGGAKGVAYIGALQAMAEKRCWFRSVAGASTGAITAALIAGGMSPEEIAATTDSAFKQLQTGVWPGIQSLQKATGYFRSDKLRVWLNQLLKEQVALKTGVVLDKDAVVTFQQLYDTTGIELNVVAADLSSKSQIIFSHNKKETPNCGVADAVVASSSIPFVFASRLLQVGNGENGKPVFYHTIVDGGVWSNFPMYIFEDDAFRESYERVPRKIESREILGFILQESDEQAPPGGGDVKFVSEVPAVRFLAREWNEDKAAKVSESLVSKIAALLLYPFYLLGRLAEVISGIERGRWPTPRWRWVNYLVHSISGFLGGIHPILFGIVAIWLVTKGAWAVTNVFVAQMIGDISTSEWSNPFRYLSLLIVVVLTLSAIVVAILLPYVTLLGVVANHILLRPSRRILYGLVTTFVAGSGAPAWAISKTNIVFLPIPSTINTLSFKMKPSERTDLIDSAKQITLAKLAKVLSE
jgi:hypothetical protein